MSEGNRVTHKEFADSDIIFKKCCELASVKNTKRQAAKFRMGKGKAYSKKEFLNEKPNTEV